MVTNRIFPSCKQFAAVKTSVLLRSKFDSVPLRCAVFEVWRCLRYSGRNTQCEICRFVIGRRIFVTTWPWKYIYRVFLSVPLDTLKTPACKLPAHSPQCSAICHSARYQTTLTAVSKMKTLQILLLTVAVGLLLHVGKHPATYTGLAEQNCGMFCLLPVMCYEQLL